MSALGDRCATCGLHGADRVCYRCGAVLHDSICCGGYCDRGMMCLACEGDSLRRAARIAQLKRERVDINMSIRGTQERLRELEGDLDAVEWELRQAQESAP